MALSPEQRQAVQDAWNRGIRDKSSLYAAAGMGFPGVAPAGAPAGVPPPQGDPGFIEQGGLLGLAARTPGSQQLLQGLGWLGENVLSPAATAGVVGVQSLIPGEQMREKAFKEGFSQATEQGEDPFSAFVGGLKAGGHEQFEDPITTGIGINLPGSGIPIPSWIAGEGKRLDEIDVGQLIAELPVEILGVKGAGKLTRPARWATAEKLAGVRTIDAATGAEKVGRVSAIAPFLIKPSKTNLSRKYKSELRQRAEAPRSEWSAPAPGVYRPDPSPDVRAVIPSNRNVGRRPGLGEEEFTYEPVGRALAKTEPLAVAGLDQVVSKDPGFIGQSPQLYSDAAIRTPSGKPIQSVEVSSEILRDVASDGERPIVFVDMIDADGIKIRQGFYNSTGGNSGIASEWLPFFGQNLPDNPFHVSGAGDGWFIKPEPISGVVDNPRFLNYVTESLQAANERIDASSFSERKIRYGSEELYLISKALSRRFPNIVRDTRRNVTGADSGIIASPAELNNFIFRGVLPDSLADRARPLLHSYERPGGAYEYYPAPGPIQEMGGIQRVTPADPGFDLDIPVRAEDLPLVARFDPTKSPYYDVGQQRIPSELIELEEIRLRALSLSPDEQKIRKATSADVRLRARRRTGITTKAVATVIPVFLSDVSAINFTKIQKALAARDKAAKALAKNEQDFNAKAAAINVDIENVKTTLVSIGKAREELIGKNQAPDKGIWLEVSSEWDGIKKRWLAGEIGRPNAASIVALGSTNQGKAALTRIGKQELDAENLLRTQENKLKNLDDERSKAITPEVDAKLPGAAAPAVVIDPKDVERIDFLKTQLGSDYFKEPYGIPQGSIGYTAESALLTPEMRGSRGFVPPKKLTKKELETNIAEANQDLVDARKSVAAAKKEKSGVSAAEEQLADATDELKKARAAATEKASAEHAVHVAAYKKYVDEVKATRWRFTNEIAELEAKAAPVSPVAKTPAVQAAPTPRPPKPVNEYKGKSPTQLGFSLPPLLRIFINDGIVTADMTRKPANLSQAKEFVDSKAQRIAIYHQALELVKKRKEQQPWSLTTKPRSLMEIYQDANLPSEYAIQEAIRKTETWEYQLKEYIQKVEGDFRPFGTARGGALHPTHNELLKAWEKTAVPATAQPVTAKPKAVPTPAKPKPITEIGRLKQDLSVATSALLTVVEDAKKILEKNYAGTERKITGADLVGLSRLTPFKKEIFTRVLRQGELEGARRPEFDLGEVPPEVIKARIAEETADRLRRIESHNTMRRVLAGQIAENKASLQAVLQDSSRRLLTDPIEARRNSQGINVRSIHEPIASENGYPGPRPELPGMGGGSDLPPRGTLAGQSDVTPDPKGKSQYVTTDAFSIKDQMLQFLQTAAHQKIKLAEWVTRTRSDTNVWWLSKWTADFLNATVGSTNRWIVNNSRAMAAMYAYSSRIDNRLPVAHRDVINFLQKKYLGIGTTQLDRIYRFYPVNRDSASPSYGRWGTTDFYANDIAEAYWLHRWLGTDRFHESVGAFLKDPSKKGGADVLTEPELATRGFGAKFSTFFKNSDQSYMTREQRQAAWDKFFRETTDSEIGTRAGAFLDDLGDFFDEMERMIDPSIDIGRAANGARLLARNVLYFQSGQRAFSRSSAHAPRFYEHLQEGSEAGVQYDFNLIAQMVHHHTYASKVMIDRELRDLVLDPKDGFALAYDRLAGRVVSLRGEKGFENLDDATQTYIREIDDRLQGIKDAEFNLENGLDVIDEYSTPAKIEAARKALDAKVIDDIASGKKVLQIPSNMFWANNLEGKMSLAALRNIYGIGTKGVGVAKDTPGVPARSQQADNILRRLGIEDVAVVSARELQNLEEAFRGVAHLQGVDAALPGPGYVAGKFQGIVDFWRLASTGFDAAYSMTLGYPLMFKDPANWTRMTWANLQALRDPNVMARMVQRDPSLQADIDFLIDMRIGLGDQEVYKWLQSNGQINKNSYYDLLKADKDAGGAGLLKQLGSPKKVLARLASPLQRSYNTGTLLTRVYWLRALRPSFTYMKNGRQVVDTAGLKSQIERITGAINQTDLGVTIGRKRTENFWLGLSPRLTRSTASVVLDAQRGMFEIVRTRDSNLLTFALSQGKKGKSPLQVAQDAAEKAGRTLTDDEIFAARELTKQALSLGNLSTLLAATLMTFYTTSYGLAIMNGKSNTEAQQLAMDSMNPLEGKKFMAVQIGGTWYGVGGFFRSLSALNAKLINASYEAVRGNFKPFNDFRSSDQFDNPLIMTMRNRGAPAVNFSGSLLEGVTASFGSPIDAAPFDVIDNVWQGGLKSAASFLPFALQGIVDGEGLTSLWGLTGARTSQQTLGDASVHIARKAMGLDVSSTRDIPESWIKTNVLYPLVEEQYGLSARASNSAFGQFMRRRGDLRSEFEDKIAKEWAAGNTNYEMIAYYFDERNILNAKVEEFKRAVGMDDMETRGRDPIAYALKEWREIWESEEVVQAVKDERWDIIEDKREALLKNFTPEQQAAVLRSGNGIHREILALMKPESQERYLDLFAKRKDWIISTTKNPDYAKTLVLYLTGEMFPTIGVPRGITTESVGSPTRTSYQAYGSGVSFSPQGIRDVAISPTRQLVSL